MRSIGRPMKIASRARANSPRGGSTYAHIALLSLYLPLLFPLYTCYECFPPRKGAEGREPRHYHGKRFGSELREHIACVYVSYPIHIRSSNCENRRGAHFFSVILGDLQCESGLFICTGRSLYCTINSRRSITTGDMDFLRNV